MNILDIQMNHFGRFTDQNMSFHSGVNVIYGENETGKSTMHAFIRAMFYGIEKLRGRASKNDEYNLRMPWENGSYFAGSMRFESGGKVFHIYRNFSRQEKEVRLYCETDGEELNAEQGDLDILLEGIEENAFCNTFFLGQQTGETNEGLVTAIRNFMVNSKTSGIPDVDLKKTREKLLKEKKTLEAEKKKIMAERIEKLQEVRMRADYAKQELSELYHEEKTCREKLGQLKERDKQLEEEFFSESEQESFEGEKEGILWKTGKIFMAIFAVIAMAVALVAVQWEIKAAACTVILLACLGVRFFGRHDQELKAEKQEWEIRQGERRMQEMLARQERLLSQQNKEAPLRQKLMMNLEWVQNTQREKEILLQSLEEQCQDMQSSGKKVQELEENLEAVYLAIDTIEEVTAEMYQEFSGRLNQRVSEILTVITGGRYQKVFLDEDMQVKIHTPQKLLNIEQVSRGTMEQIYFSLRMAAAELLNPGETLPILLDDAFATYDNTRLENTLRWLCTCGHQVILFTCQKREQEILQKIYAGENV